MHSVLEADKSLFQLLNYQWHNAVLDLICPLVRNANFWLPLYLFLLIFSILNVRSWWWFLLFAFATPALTDLLSSHLIKEFVFRLRPCRDPDMLGRIRVLASYCPQSSSFTSSHATNHFGLATFLCLNLKPIVGRSVYWLYAWAFLIVYAQIYVGVHFPLDVLSGAVLGIACGYLTTWLYRTVSRNLPVKDNLN